MKTPQIPIPAPTVEQGKARWANLQAHTQTQHTPGPWKARKTDLGNSATWITADGEGTVSIIAVISTGNPQQEANARLIAAAPDLLAALKQMIQTFSGVADKAHWPSDHITRAVIATSKAVIQKAEGRNA